MLLVAESSNAANPFLLADEHFGASGDSLALRAEREQVVGDCFRHLAATEPAIPMATKRSRAACPASDCVSRIGIVLRKLLDADGAYAAELAGADAQSAAKATKQHWISLTAEGRIGSCRRRSGPLIGSDLSTRMTLGGEAAADRELETVMFSTEAAILVACAIIQRR